MCRVMSLLNRILGLYRAFSEAWRKSSRWAMSAQQSDFSANAILASGFVAQTKLRWAQQYPRPPAVSRTGSRFVAGLTRGQCAGIAPRCDAVISVFADGGVLDLPLLY
jgi:hypothetical protein